MEFKVNDSILEMWILLGSITKLSNYIVLYSRSLQEDLSIFKYIEQTIKIGYDFLNTQDYFKLIFIKFKIQICFRLE